MANSNPTRLSPAELRRRLLAAPAEAAGDAVPVAEAIAPAAPRFMARSQTRVGATMQAIDVDALPLEVLAPFATKPMGVSEVRHDPNQYRAQPSGYHPSYALPPSNAELDQLRAQNAEMSRIIEEMRPLLEEASLQENRHQTREQEFQKQLGERDAQVEELRVKVAELEAHIASIPPPKVPKTRDELEEWSDELEKEAARITQERRRMDEDRGQLREDEEALERQMREMEISMARERAIMARQETELKRLSAEIQHELEVLQRGDGTLREQLAKFQRKHQEVLARGAGGPPAAPVTAPPPVVAPKDSGLLSRLFRGTK